MYVFRSTLLSIDYQTSKRNNIIPYTLIIDDGFPEMKIRLVNAIAKKNPDELACALNAIERSIPPARMADQDKELQKKAKEELKTLEKNISIHLDCFFLSNLITEFL